MPDPTNAELIKALLEHLPQCSVFSICRATLLSISADLDRLEEFEKQRSYKAYDLKDESGW